MADRKELLSEDELDALMATADDSGKGLDVAGQSGVYRAYDFHDKAQSVVRHLKPLELISEKWSLTFNKSLEVFFKVPVEILPLSAEVKKKEDVLAAVSMPVAVNLYSLNNGEHQGLCLIPGELLSVCVEQYFGGSRKISGEGKSGERELTAAEKRMNENVQERFAQAMTSGWSDFLEVIPVFEKTETNPDLLRIKDMEARVVVFAFEIVINEFKSKVSWAVPYELVEKINGKNSSADPGGQKADWKNYFTREIQVVTVESSAVLVKMETSLGKFIGMKKGDTLFFEMPEEASLFIDKTLVATGKYGAFNGKKAVKLKRVSSNFKTQ